MDRSTVGNNYKQTILRQSFVFNTGGTNNLQRSFINTALVNDSMAFGDDLRKSRIQNLPNYKKTNLGENIQFIVVFQTIEIERLSSEIEVLRVKLKELQRQLFNSANYEVQIRELTEKCFSMQREREQYRQEMQKLNKICQTLYHQNQMLKQRLSEMDISLKQKFQSQKLKNAQLMQEIEKWKSRYQAAEKSKAKELEDLRNLMECQRKSMIDREIREMTIRFQNERSTLENQIRKGRQLLQNRNRQIDDYKQRMQKMQIQVMELRNYEGMLADNENKIAMLSQEMLRLNQVLGGKEDQLSGLRQAVQRLNQQLKEQAEWEAENKRLKQVIDSKGKEVEEWKVRSARLEDQVVRAKQLNHYVQQLQNKLNLASKQIDRLNNVLRQKINEIDQWKKRLSDKEMQFSKLKNLQYQIQGYQTKMTNLKIQNDRINGILKSRLSQIEEWKGRHAQIEARLNEYAYVEKDKKALQEKFNSLIKNSEQLKFYISKLQQQLSTFKKQQSRYVDIDRQNQQLGKDIDRLNNALRNSNNEIQAYKTKITNMEQTFNQYKNIEMKVKDFEHKIIMLTQEIERLNQLITEKNALISNLERDQLDLHSKINHYKSYEQKIQESQNYIRKYQEQVEAVKRELDGWQRKTKEADAKAQRVEGELFKHVQEKDRLSNMLKTKNAEYETLRGSLSNYQAQARKAQHLQATCQQLNNHIMGLVGDIQGYQRNYKTMEQQLQKQRQFTNQFAFKIIILSAEVQRLSKQGGAGGVKSKEFLELQENYSRLQSKVQSKNNEIDMLQTKITNLESKYEFLLQRRITQLYQQFNRLLEEAQKSQRDTQALMRKIEEYQDYARRIHILGNQIDQLTKEKFSLQEQVKAMRLRYADNINFEDRQSGLLMKTVLMALEIESLRGRIEQREQTAEEMRRSILEPVRRI